MAVFRVNKTRDYTVMSNKHLKEKEMSLKAKGLLSIMLSLPENWDYSINGLVAICKENESAVNSTLKELKDFGYLRVDKLMPNKTTSGRIEYIYNIFETPNEKQEQQKQALENQGVEFQYLENQVQLNTNNEIFNNKKNNNNIYKKQKHSYGEYKNILLTDEEYDKLVKDYGAMRTDEAIQFLDEAIEMKGYKYKSHYLAMKKWVFEAAEKQREQDIKKIDNEFADLISGLDISDINELFRK